MQYDETVAYYWLKLYVNKDHCALCGNHGIIDTTGVKTPAGIDVGGKYFCICPNGQILRNANKENPRPEYVDVK